jgi:hypothetical protein
MKRTARPTDNRSAWSPQSHLDSRTWDNSRARLMAGAEFMSSPGGRRGLGATPNSLLLSGSIAVLVLVLLFSYFAPLVGFVLTLLGFLGAVGLQMGWRRLRARRSQSWPLVDAHLEGGSVHEAGGRHPAYVLEVAYSYTVDGHIFSGEYQRTFPTRDEADRLLRNLQQFGIRVRVDPLRPDRSGFDPYRDI